MSTIAPYKRKTQFYETDQMGIIHHANYVLWMEEARVDFMEQMGFGYEKSVESGVHIAVIGISCNYRSMVRFGDTVSIKVTITKMGPVRMVVSYEITDAATGELRTTGESTHCFVRDGENTLVRLNRTLPELYDLFTRSCESQ
mgnify:CR=1 FL=1